MKLLWHSNSPTAPTGYGVQTALFASRLNRDYDVAISCFFGLEGAPVMWNGILMLPGLGGNFGAEFMPLHAMRWGDGDPRNTLTVTLMDVWVLPSNLNEQLGGNLICWTPIDHDPAPPEVMRFLRESESIPLAMSKHGMDALAEVHPLYVPHGVDTSVYRPIPRDEARKIVGFDPDAFVIGMVSANKGRPSRKGFQQAFEAFKAFHDRHENSYLYLHTSLKPEWLQGEALRELSDSLDIPPDALIWANQYRLHFDPHSPEQMAALFSGMDVLLNPTMGGGFEIAQLEAAACGVPTITTDFTGMPESAGPTPWLVTPPKGTKGYWTAQRSWNVIADVTQLVDAMEEAYRMPAKERRSLARAMRKHAEAYDADKVYAEHMLPAIRKAEKRIRKRSISFDVIEGLSATMPERNLRDDGPSISVVTPWYEHPELAEEYWKALDGEKTHEVIVVDNGSATPVERAAIRLEENAGFARANNIGLEKATGDAVLFLNNDVALGIPGWLEAIRAELKPGVLVGANVRSEQHAAVDGQVVPYLDGWCIAAMKEDLEELGGWSEEYEEPAYFSDNDLCLRAERAGMRFMAVAPPLVHLLNRTAGPGVGEVAQVTQRNYQIYAAKVREQSAVAA